MLVRFHMPCACPPHVNQRCAYMLEAKIIHKYIAITNITKVSQSQNTQNRQDLYFRTQPRPFPFVPFILPHSQT